ncbi:nucleotide disphospho-sugar-binding domain-containing protein [Streptomyces sp. NPDC001709]
MPRSPRVGAYEPHRILFVTWSWRTHLYAMAPWAWALRAAGHEVRVACQPSLVPTAAELGLPAVPVGPDVDVRPDFRRLVIGESSSAARHNKVPRALALFTRLADVMADDLVQLARSARPDLVVFDPTAFAGPLAAAAVGAPAVRCLYGPDLLRPFHRLLPELLQLTCQRLGLPEVPGTGDLTLDPNPACLALPSDQRRLVTRYVPCNGPEAARATLGPTPRRRVCVTWGHTMAALDERHFLAGDVARTVAELDVEVVALVSRQQFALLRRTPPSVQVLVDVPLHSVLPHCDALVSQGGAGSVLTGLAAGLPQVAVGQLPDHLAIARQMEAGGAGRALSGPDATPDAVLSAVFDVLERPSFTTQARKARQENADRSAPTALIGDLLEIVRSA